MQQMQTWLALSLSSNLLVKHFDDQSESNSLTSPEGTKSSNLDGDIPHIK